MNIKQALPLARGRSGSRGRQRGGDKKQTFDQTNPYVINRRYTWTTEAESLASESSCVPSQGRTSPTKRQETGSFERRNAPRQSVNENNKRATGIWQGERKHQQEELFSFDSGISRPMRIFCGRSEQTLQQQQFITVHSPGIQGRRDGGLSPVTVEFDNQDDYPEKALWSSEDSCSFSCEAQASQHPNFADFATLQRNQANSCASTTSQSPQRAVINTSRASTMPSTLALTSAGERDGALSVGDCSSVSGDSFGCKVGCLPVSDQSLRDQPLSDHASHHVESRTLIEDTYFHNEHLIMIEMRTGKNWSPCHVGGIHSRAASTDGSIRVQGNALEKGTVERQFEGNRSRTNSADDSVPANRPVRGRTKSLGRGEITFLTARNTGLLSSSTSLGSVEISSQMVVRGEADTGYSDELLQRENRRFGEGAAFIMSTMMSSPLVKLPLNHDDDTDNIEIVCPGWSKSINRLASQYGKDHVRVADALIEHGIAQIHAEAYLQASMSLEPAVAIYRRRKQGSSLALARALQHLGTAYHKIESMTEKPVLCIKSKKCFGEALKIRYEELGQLHPDTASIVNCLGGVYMTTRNYTDARLSYLEVVSVRQAIFGIFHPSVAVAAHALANAALYLGDLEEATIYYCKALDIYEALNLRQDHPSLARLLRDMKRMQRLRET
ncbi:hypothetical protein ACA910_017059 [Epithemia clementina (nom. ined.)]